MDIMVFNPKYPLYIHNYFFYIFSWIIFIGEFYFNLFFKSSDQIKLIVKKILIIKELFKI